MNAIEKLSTIKKQLEFARAFFRLTANPNDTVRVFEVEGALMQGATQESLDKLVAYFKTVPEVKQIMAERYLAPDYKVEDLASCEPGTLGYAYYRHMHDNGFTPDFFPPIKPEDDLSYFKLRMRQTHDIWHVVCGYSPSIEDEIGLQAFYTAQLPASFSMTLIAAGVLYGATRDQKLIPSLMDAIKTGWENGRAAKSLHAVHWEEMWNRSLDEIRREYNVKPVKSLYDFSPTNSEMAIA